MAKGLQANPQSLGNTAKVEYEFGTLYYYQGAYYRYAKFVDAVTYGVGQSLGWASANGTAVSNDRAGGSALGTAPRPVAGICLSVMTQNYYGFMQVAGIGKVALYGVDVDDSDNEIAAGDFLVMDDATDGHSQVMADTEEHLVFAVAIAAGVSSYVPSGSWYCKGMI